MSPLLRHPHAVPSLFSQGSEFDEGDPKLNRLVGPVASRLETLAVAVGLNGEETVSGRTGRALAGSSIAIFMIALPLLKATKLLVSVSLAH